MRHAGPSVYYGRLPLTLKHLGSSVFDIPTATSTIVQASTQIWPIQTYFGCIPRPTPDPVPTPDPPASSTTPPPERSSSTQFSSWSQSQTTVNGQVSISSIFITVAPTGQVDTTSAPKSKPNVGAIVGGSLGGIFGISLFLFVIFYLMRANRKMKRELAEHEAKESAMDRVDMTPVPYTVSLSRFKTLVVLTETLRHSIILMITLVHRRLPIHTTTNIPQCALLPG